MSTTAPSPAAAKLRPVPADLVVEPRVARLRPCFQPVAAVLLQNEPNAAPRPLALTSPASLTRIASQAQPASSSPDLAGLLLLC